METLRGNPNSYPDLIIPVDICPVCGASRISLRASLKEKPHVRDVEYIGVGGCIIRRQEIRQTDNYTIARMITDNCPECRQALGLRR